MPTLTNTLPELQQAEARLRAAAAARGISYVIADYGALRSQADTAKILQYRAQDYAAAVRVNPDTARTPITRWRPIAPFGSSYHNYGAAFDILVTGHPPGVNGYSVLGALAPQLGLRWGGTNPTKVDPPHFELPISLTAARIKWLGPVGAAGATGRAIGVAAANNPVAVIAGVLILTLLVAAFRAR